MPHAIAHMETEDLEDLEGYKACPEKRGQYDHPNHVEPIK